MIVVVPGAGPQHHAEMSLAVDQHPVGAFGPGGRYPAFRITVRPGRPRRSRHEPYALAGEDIIERTGELGVAVPDEEPEGADPISDVHDQGAGLLSSPYAMGVPGHPGGCAPAGSLSP